jgi:RNA polymerase sigma-70 factor (ECF subfamily)
MDELTDFATAARRGDQGAMREFIRLSRKEVWSLCAHLVDPQSADDLTQETYLRVFRALRSFKGESSARTWLLSIARRTCMDELRSRVRERRRDVLLIDQHRAQAVVADVAGQVEVQTLLSQLDTERRTSFVLTQLIGLSYEEAAQVCGCPVGTIRSRVARARADLIKALSADRTASPPRTRAATGRAEPGAPSHRTGDLSHRTVRGGSRLPSAGVGRRREQRSQREQREG